VSIYINLDPLSLDALKRFAEKTGKPVREVAQDVLQIIFQGQASFVAIEPPPNAEQLEKIQDFIKETMGFKKEIPDGN
jgi:hypothetical protein